MTRVAEILGIEEEKVNDAFNQARKEMFESRLKEAVESGKLTQEDADEKLEWLKSNPELKYYKKMGKHNWQGKKDKQGKEYKHDKEHSKKTD